MKLKTSFFSKSRIAPEPTATPAGNHAHGTAKADGAATITQPLGRPPRSHSAGDAGKPKGLLSSMQASLNSAQKSLLSLQRKMSQQQTAPSPRPSREASGRANVANRRPTATAFSKQQRPATQASGNAPQRSTRPPAAAAPTRPAPKAGPMRRPDHAQAMQGMKSLAQPKTSTHYGKHDALINMLHEERDPTPLEQHLLNELKAELTVPKHRADHAQAQAQAEKPTAQRTRQELSIRELNKQLAALDKAKYAISSKMLEEDRGPTPQEQHVLDSRTALIKTRNQARDRQLANMLHALGPLETISAPRTTTSSRVEVQRDVMQFNANKLRTAQAQGLQPAKFARHYARAERRLQSLRDSGAPFADVQRLQRMMQGYHNLVNLENIVRHTDDQLQRMGGPRLMDSMPTTPEERTQMRENDYAEQEEAMRNGY
ncbi:hypothetical protein [Xanthomonas graminis]|uniref:hypothetical protein n=1 Tax=Xanthomonas graminis TaxID=3390026 RepID=UPI001F1732BF|nr:hypothetical protein [Xanthomonas translucens]UKE73274.1 hypothetical protein KFS85_20070 [Xanthomonas translucens pv. phleipratensis]